MGWLDLLHIVDSSFPTGAYVHSHGLETLAPADADELEQVLLTRVGETLGRFELVFLVQAYRRDLRELDELFHAMLLPREARAASCAIGTSLLRSACELLPGARLAEFLWHGPHRHQPVAFGAIAATCGAPPRLAASTYAFQSLRASTSVMQRLGRLGQRDAQAVLHRLKLAVQAAVGTAMELPFELAGGFAPAWDIASMRHERTSVRLFAS